MLPNVLKPKCLLYPKDWKIMQKVTVIPTSIIFRTSLSPVILLFC